MKVRERIYLLINTYRFVEIESANNTVDVESDKLD